MLLWVVALDVIAPMVFSQTEAKEIIELSLRLGQLHIYHQTGLSLLMEESVVAMAFNVFQLCLKGITFYMHRLQSKPLQTLEHHIVTIPFFKELRDSSTLSSFLQN